MRSVITALGLLVLTLSGCGGGGSASGPDAVFADVQIASIPNSNLQRIFADPVRAAIYVSDSAQNVVHIINTATNTLETSIQVGSQPTKMDMNVGADSLFVMNSGGSSVTVIDIDTRSVKSVINLPGTPDAIAVSSSDHLYVSMKSGAIPAVVGYDISSMPYTQSFSSDTGLIIMGRNSSHSRLYMHDWTTITTTLLWDVSISPPVELGSGDISSGAATATPVGASDRVFISPALEYWQPRSPNYGGDVPLFNGFTRDATLNVQWTAIATASSSLGNELAVAHSDSVTNPLVPAETMHGAILDPVNGFVVGVIPDLHIFSGNSFAPVAVLGLSDFILHNGLVYATNGDIYFLKGLNTSTSVSYIDR